MHGELCMEVLQGKSCMVGCAWRVMHGELCMMGATFGYVTSNKTMLLCIPCVTTFVKYHLKQQLRTQP